MRAAPRIAVVSAAILAGVTRDAQADEAFRCGKWVVTSELTLGELISRCGPPTTRTSRTDDVLVRNRNNGLMLKAGQTTTETLTWTRGPRAAAMVVTVVDGAIKSIERKP